MKLFTTITSERGKPVTKSGNEHISVHVIDENRKVIAHIKILEDKRICVIIGENARLITVPRAIEERKCVAITHYTDIIACGHCYECQKTN